MFGATNLNIFWLLQKNSVFQGSGQFICIIVKNFISAIITGSMSYFILDTPSIYVVNSILKIKVKCIFILVIRIYVRFINSLLTKNTD